MGIGVELESPIIFTISINSKRLLGVVISILFTHDALQSHLEIERSIINIDHDRTYAVVPFELFPVDKGTSFVGKVRKALVELFGEEMSYSQNEKKRIIKVTKVEGGGGNLWIGKST